MKGNKSEKSGDFKDPLAILVGNLGGDSADLKCSGKSIRNDSITGKVNFLVKNVSS